MLLENHFTAEHLWQLLQPITANIVAPVNQTTSVFLPFNDEVRLKQYFNEHGNEISSVIIEGIRELVEFTCATELFLQKIRTLCDEYAAVFIADGVQCGYGEAGNFFHTIMRRKCRYLYHGKRNGQWFPVAGIIIAPHIQPKHFMLGTTFGGNHLACAAALAVLEVIEKENLMQNALQVGNYLMKS